jgi:hypothetical protein
MITYNTLIIKELKNPIQPQTDPGTRLSAILSSFAAFIQAGFAS